MRHGTCDVKRSFCGGSVSYTHLTVDHLGLKADTIQVLLHPLEAVVIGVDGNHAGKGRLAFQQVGGFAAGGGAGVQHPLARLGIEQGGGLLGGTVLHRAVTLLEAGQLGHVAGAVSYTHLNILTMA